MVVATLLLTACASSTEAPLLGPPGSDPSVTVGSSATVGVDQDSLGSGATSQSTVTTESAAVLPVGFETTMARATLPDGTVCELCVWLADTAPQRSKGLMFVTELGAADAMAFLYPEPHTGTFWMKDTVLPLSIAFFAPDGAFVTSFDMEPCTQPTCPSYRTPDDFLVAVEVPQGDLAELGLVEGSALELLDLPCDD